MADALTGANQTAYRRHRSGRIGGTIGGLWVKAGHPVLFSSRHPEELKDLIAGLGELAKAGTVEQAIAFGDVIFVAVPYGALPQIGKDYAAALKGKIVLDAAMRSLRATWCHRQGSRARRRRRHVAKYLVGTRLVRTFNTMNYKIFAARRTVPIQNSRSRLPATMSKRSRSRPVWCATQVSIRSWSANWPMRAVFSAAIPDTASR